MENIGNATAAEKYEKQVPMCYRRPTFTDPQYVFYEDLLSLPERIEINLNFYIWNQSITWAVDPSQVWASRVYGHRPTDVFNGNARRLLVETRQKWSKIQQASLRPQRNRKHFEVFQQRRCKEINQSIYWRHTISISFAAQGWSERSDTNGRHQRDVGTGENRKPKRHANQLHTERTISQHLRVRRG